MFAVSLLGTKTVQGAEGVGQMPVIQGIKMVTSLEQAVFFALQQLRAEWNVCDTDDVEKQKYHDLMQRHGSSSAVFNFAANEIASMSQHLDTFRVGMLGLLAAEFASFVAAATEAPEQSALDLRLSDETAICVRHVEKII